ncbi:hypothetical protein NPIL_377301, partial [Nephila pilipes]
IYSKESVDGELGGEESNSNNVIDNENNVTSADAMIVPKHRVDAAHLILSLNSKVPNPNCATEYKKGYVMRKCCMDPSGKKSEYINFDLF